MIPYFRKVKVVEQVLEKTRIQSKAKTQEELDKYSDSDEDWNPEDKDDKTLKERIDAKVSDKFNDSANKTEDVEKKDNKDTDRAHKESLAVEKQSDKVQAEIIAEEKVVDEFDELPDLEVEIEAKSKDSNKEEKQAMIKSSDTDSSKGVGNVQEVEGKSSENSCVSDIKDTVEDKTQSKPEEDDLCFDWEKDNTASHVREESIDCKTKEIVDKQDDSSKLDFDSLDENKENIDPNGDHSQTEITDKPTTSHEERTTPKNSASKKHKKIAALAGIDLDSVKPCLSGDLESFVCLEEEEEAPKHPGVQKLMERLSKHAKKAEPKKMKDTDIR